MAFTMGWRGSLFLLKGFLEGFLKVQVRGAPNAIQEESWAHNIRVRGMSTDAANNGALVGLAVGVQRTVQIVRIDSPVKSIKCLSPAARGGAVSGFHMSKFLALQQSVPSMKGLAPPSTGRERQSNGIVGYMDRSESNRAEGRDVA